MKIVFRVRYRTVFGQSLWVRLRAIGDSGALQELPLRWIHAEQWQGELEWPAGHPLEYGYQLREEGNGLQLDEWGGLRCLEPVAVSTIILCDTWRASATIDYVMETKAFRHLLPGRTSAGKGLQHRQGNHEFGIHVTALPDGVGVCLCGNAPELGGWDLARALPMEEVSANEWRVVVDLEPGQERQYKYGLWDQAAGRALAFEEGSHRVLEAHRLDVAQFTRVHDEGFHRRADDWFRGAGVAVPVFSLRSEHGLGVGEFADLAALGEWAAGGGLTMIQILPVNDTTSAHDWTDSYPYSAISVFALHPIYLRIDDLALPMPADFHDELAKLKRQLNAHDEVKHREVMQVKWRLTRRIFDVHRQAILADPAFHTFIDDYRDWLVPYGAFCVLRDDCGTADFQQWGEWAVFDRQRVEAMVDDSHPRHGDLLYHLWLQHELDRQLRAAVKRLHDLGVVLKGDLPIGIDRQSADAWSAPHLFKLDAQAGAPPDAFAEKGQNWGFPTYDWERMKDDGYAWWRSRFRHLSRYFDAFRIDHILGFFRIWQVPLEQVEGIMGWFDPVGPIAIDEFRERRIAFDFDRFCRPWLPQDLIEERFGADAEEVIARYLSRLPDGGYRLNDEVSSQRRIVDHFAAQLAECPDGAGRLERIRAGLMDCVSEVLFFEEPGSERTRFHPRFFVHKTRSFADLDAVQQERIDALVVDYFFRRQDFHWRARGFEKLPAMRRASDMLLCGEDLGLVPDCVPGVMNELGILSLEIQRMPKSAHLEFGDPATAPYLSVVSPSTHDMSTLRQWWREDRRVTERFAWLQLGEARPPEELTGELAGRIIRQHLESPAMWAVVPLQDWLAMDEGLRRQDIDAERINVPAIMPYEWRYRMHLTISDLQQARDLNGRILCLIKDGARTGSRHA